MLTRRKILMATAATMCVGGIGAGRAIALSLEPMAVDDANALSLACGGPELHGKLLADAWLVLDDEVKAGRRLANDVETVVCPICQCRLKVTLDDAF